MSWRILEGKRGLLLLVPVVYLVVAAEFSGGLKEQPCLVLSWTAEELGRRLDEAGGSDAVQLGLWLDQAFVCAFAVIGTWLFKGSRLRYLPVAAAILDTAENLLLANLIESEVSDASAVMLGTIAVLKFTAYGAVGVVALVSVVMLTKRRKATNEYAE